MSLDDIGIALLIVAILLLIWWIATIHHHVNRKPTAIRISFSPHGARRFRWRRFWRRVMDTTIQPGEIKAGTLEILDQNGNVLAGATFDAQPVLESSDPNVFTVEGNTNDFFALEIAGVASGTATLSAQGTSGGNPLQAGIATVTVEVTLTATSINIRF